jgi:hypothetical protein
MHTEGSLRAVRRGDWLAVSAWAGAIVLTAGAVWLVHPAASPETPGPIVPPTPEQRLLASDIERFALNALLVPLIDHEAWPMRWADPSLAMSCNTGSHVHIDGRPLQPGTPIVDRTFFVTWTLQGCLPFGLGGPELTGRARLRVSRQPDGLAAMVWLTDLQVQRQGHSVVMNKTFFAHVK